MDGPWQIGQKSAREYGAVAREGAKAVKQIGPSSEKTVLEECCECVKYLSCTPTIETRLTTFRSTSPPRWAWMPSSSPRPEKE